MNKLYLLFILILFFSDTVNARQTRVSADQFNQLYFLRSWDSRSEALGKTGVAYTNGNYSIRSNPALIGLNESDLVLDGNNSTPFFLDSDANHFFFGLSARMPAGLYLGISRAQLSYGQSDVNRLDEGGTKTRSPRDFINTISLAYKLNTDFDLSFGVNANQLNVDLYSPIIKDWYFDIGSAFGKDYSFLSTSNKVLFGVSLQNITSKKAYPDIQSDYFLDIDPFGNGDDGSIPSRLARIGYPIPQILTLGVSNELHVDGSILNRSGSIIRLLTTIEYQEVLKSEINHRTSFGVEIGLLELLIARVGYFEQRRSPESDTSNKSFYKEWTQGFGVVIPIDLITKSVIPVTLRLDYTKSAHPMSKDIIEDFDVKYFTSFGLSLGVKF